MHTIFVGKVVCMPSKEDEPDELSLPPSEPLLTSGEDPRHPAE
jgi:hypothetical protein